MTTESDAPVYIVAEIANDGLTFGWTSAVFTDPSDALNEQADARDAGLMEEQVWELRRCRQLVSVPAGANAEETRVGQALTGAPRGGMGAPDAREVVAVPVRG